MLLFKLSFILTLLSSLTACITITQTLKQPDTADFTFYITIAQPKAVKGEAPVHITRSQIVKPVKVTQRCQWLRQLKAFPVFDTTPFKAEGKELLFIESALDHIRKTERLIEHTRQDC